VLNLFFKIIYSIASKKMGKVNKSNNKLIEKNVKKKNTIDSSVIIKTNLSLNLCLFYSIYNSLNEVDRKKFSGNSKVGKEHNLFMKLCSKGNLLNIFNCYKFYNFRLSGKTEKQKQDGYNAEDVRFYLRYLADKKHIRHFTFIRKFPEKLNLHKILNYEGPHSLVIFGWAASTEVRQYKKNKIKTFLAKHNIKKISGNSDFFQIISHINIIYFIHLYRE
jgi:hypothetical protein